MRKLLSIALTLAALSGTATFVDANLNAAEARIKAIKTHCVTNMTTGMQVCTTTYIK
jgi:hypothetical protein